MNPESYLIDTILALNPVDDIYKAISFSRILFGMNKQKYDYQLRTIDYLEQNVYLQMPLHECYELYSMYKQYSLNYQINYFTKKQTTTKIPLSKLRDSMRKLYFGLIELIFMSGIIETDYSIGDSGNLSYKTMKEGFKFEQ